jgi:hypothetical protein
MPEVVWLASLPSPIMTGTSEGWSAGPLSIFRSDLITFWITSFTSSGLSGMEIITASLIVLQTLQTNTKTLKYSDETEIHTTGEELSRNCSSEFIGYRELANHPLRCIECTKPSDQLKRTLLINCGNNSGRIPARRDQKQNPKLLVPATREISFLDELNRDKHSAGGEELNRDKSETNQIGLLSNRL